VDSPQPLDNEVHPAPSGPEPVPAPVGAAPTARTRRRRNWPLILAITLGVVSVLCLGTAITGYVWYNRATSPSLGSPDVAVDGYLREFLVNRNDARANGYACSDQSGLTEVKALRDDIESREKKFAISIQVSWGPLAVASHGDSADVSVNLRIQVPEANGSPSESIKQWKFATKNDSGWRVCTAHQAG
jgi:hypothetical protein